MVPPDKFTITFDEDGDSVELLFNHRALWDLETALELDMPYSQMSELISGMKIKNLHVFVWAGTAHMGKKRPTMEAIQERCLDSTRPPLLLYRDVIQAFHAGIIGKQRLQEETEAAESDNPPAQPTASPSNGATSSKSPSAVSAGPSNGSGPRPLLS